MKQVDFGSSKIARGIAKTALPMLVAQMLSLLYSVVDRIYIGRIPGEGSAALGAVGLCFPVIMLITGFTNMYGMGGAPLFSMALGRGEAPKAQKLMNTAFRLLCLTAFLITLFGELFAEPLLRLFGASALTMPAALSYLRIYLLGTLFSMITTGMNPFINAQGFPNIGMLSVVIGAVSNLLLDPLFIFVMDLGVAGAAIATVISQGLSMLFVLFHIRAGRLPVTLSFKRETHVKDYFPFAKDIIGLGSALFIMQCTNSLVQISCNTMLMRFGGEIYVSIMTIVTSVRQIMDTPITAIVEGASPIISYNYGARQAQHVRKAIFLMTGITIFYTLIMWLLIEWNPALWISIFSTDEVLLPKAAPALHLYFLTFVFQSLQAVGQTVFKALGKKKQAIFFSLFRKAIMVVPLTYLLPHIAGLGTSGVFMAEPISNFIGGLACFISMLLIVLPELKAFQDA
ncbi:MAG: MATE family efflux transporter [Lachnospiraceae bacterium]|jgi:putative MATE family efflux protein|nr:MATE family efflux transporter [Lachnospiraceae bacterium]